MLFNISLISAYYADFYALLTKHSYFIILQKNDRNKNEIYGTVQFKLYTLVQAHTCACMFNARKT